MLTYRFMDSLEKLEENTETNTTNRWAWAASMSLRQDLSVPPYLSHSPQCSLIFNARLSANNYLSWYRLGTKLVTPLSICWFLDTRNPKYLGSMCKFSGNLTVSSGKHVIFGDQPAEPRILEIGNTKPTSGSLVVMTSRDKPASTLYSKTPISLPTWGTVSYKGLWFAVYDTSWRILLYFCRGLPPRLHSRCALRRLFQHSVRPFLYGWCNVSYENGRQYVHTQIFFTMKWAPV